MSTRYQILLPALTFFLLLTSISLAQTPIDDIQYYDPITGNPDSPFWLQTVTVEGVVTAPTGIWHPNTFYIQDDTGGTLAYMFDGYAVNEGDHVELTAVVVYTEGETSEVRLNQTGWTHLNTGLAPPPTDLTTTQIKTDSENIGILARVTGSVTEVNDSDFMISDGVNELRVIVGLSTGISMADVALSDTYTIVGPIGRRDSEIKIWPRYQTDLVEGSPGAVLISYDNTNWAPKDDETWEITFMVEYSTPPTGAVFRYRIVENGPNWTTLHWVPSKSAAGIYPVSFSGASAGKPSKIEWEFGDEPDSVTVVDLADSEFAAGTWAISDIQWVDPCASDQSSPLFGEPVNIEGVVVADETNRFVVVDAWNGSNKGIYPVSFSGASAGKPSLVGVDPIILYEGDHVRLGGKVQETGGFTQISPYMNSAIDLISFGNALPEPPRVHTAVLADDVLDGDCIRGEAYESVWVRPWLSAVVDTTGFSVSGTYRVSSTGLLADALTVRHSKPLAYSPNLGEVLDITGYMGYQNDEFQLVVGSDVYLVPTGLSETPGDLPPAGAQGIIGISPNPFNPKTEIRFNVSRDNLTQLNIYNLHGELVKQLLNERLPGGQEYVRHWDGTDQQGQRQASGVYFARLRIGTEVMQVQKLMMVK